MPNQSYDYTYTGTLLYRHWMPKHSLLHIKLRVDEGTYAEHTDSLFIKDHANIKILNSLPLNHKIKFTLLDVLDPNKSVIYDGQINFKHHNKHDHQASQWDGIILDRHYSHTVPHEDYYVKFEDPHGDSAGITEYYLHDPVNIKTVQSMPMHKECKFWIYNGYYLGIASVHFFDEKKAMSGVLVKGPSKRLVDWVKDAIKNHTMIGRYSFDFDDNGNAIIYKNDQECGMLKHQMFGKGYTNSPAYLIASALDM